MTRGGLEIQHENPFQTLERVADGIYERGQSTMGEVIRDGAVITLCYVATFPLVAAKWIRHPVASAKAWCYINGPKADKYRAISENIPNPFQFFRGRERVAR